jgi:hypothetical protein
MTPPPARTYNQHHITRIRNGQRRLSIYWTWSYPWEAQRDPVTLSFQDLVGELTGHPVTVFQRVDQAGYRQPIDEGILDDTDTLLVFGLDHLTSGQEVSADEVDAIREWLRRDGTCLLLAPHHDVGFTDDLVQRQMEHEHHGDRLVPRQQRFSQYTRSLMRALDVPVHNTWGLRPAVVAGSSDIMPLNTFRDLDGLGLLN